MHRRPLWTYRHRQATREQLTVLTVTIRSAVIGDDAHAADDDDDASARWRRWPGAHAHVSDVLRGAGKVAQVCARNVPARALSAICERRVRCVSECECMQ